MPQSPWPAEVIYLFKDAAVVDDAIKFVSDKSSISIEPELEKEKHKVDDVVTVDKKHSNGFKSVRVGRDTSDLVTDVVPVMQDTFGLARKTIHLTMPREFIFHLSGCCKIHQKIYITNDVSNYILWSINNASVY
jgi:hypothetical protein